MFGIRNFLSLFFLSVLLPLVASHGSARHSRLNEVAKRQTNSVSGRVTVNSNARLTWYEVGLGACGKVNVATDFIVAMNIPQFGPGYPGPNCGKTITITANGKTTKAKVMDKCPICPQGGLDLSRGLFNYFASLDVGVLSGTWSFDDGTGGGVF